MPLTEDDPTQLFWPNRERDRRTPLNKPDNSARDRRLQCAGQLADLDLSQAA